MCARSHACYVVIFSLIHKNIGCLVRTVRTVHKLKSPTGLGQGYVCCIFPDTVIPASRFVVRAAEYRQIVAYIFQDYNRLSDGPS